MSQALNEYSRLPDLMMILACAFLSFLLLSGCASVKFETTTPTGAVITAKATSLLWDRQIKGFTFDYATGTVTLESFDTNPDKESIKELCNTIKTLATAIP